MDIATDSAGSPERSGRWSQRNCCPVPDKSARCHPDRPVARTVPTTWSRPGHFSSSQGRPRRRGQARPRGSKGRFHATGPNLAGKRSTSGLPSKLARPGQSGVVGRLICRGTQRQLRTFTPSMAMYKIRPGGAAAVSQPGLPCGQRPEEVLITARRAAVLRCVLKGE